MHSRQQKSAQNGSEGYAFRPNHTLVSLRWGDGRFPDHETVWWWFVFKGTYIGFFLNRYIETVKPKKWCVSWKMFYMKFNFQYFRQ